MKSELASATFYLSSFYFLLATAVRVAAKWADAALATAASALSSPSVLILIVVSGSHVLTSTSVMSRSVRLILASYLNLHLASHGPFF